MLTESWQAVWDAWATTPSLAMVMRAWSSFVLVLVRLSGLAVVGPVFGNAHVPTQVRAGLVLMLALMVTPTVMSVGHRGFVQLDVNRSGVIEHDEQPAALQSDGDLSREEFLAPPESEVSLARLAYLATGEFGVGVMLGLGVMAVLSGLQLAGQLIDQQSGLGLGEVFNPDLQSSTTMTGEMLFMWGVTLFLVVGPLNGHVMMVRALLQTFETIPLGRAVVDLSLLDLFRGAIESALVLGLRIAAPIIVLMSLVDLAFGFVSRTAPQINMQTVGYGFRAGLALMFVTLMLGQTTELLVDVIPLSLERLQQQWR